MFAFCGPWELPQGCWSFWDPPVSGSGHGNASDDFAATSVTVLEDTVELLKERLRQSEPPTRR